MNTEWFQNSYALLPTCPKNPLHDHRQGKLVRYSPRADYKNNGLRVLAMYEYIHRIDIDWYREWSSVIGSREKM